MPCGLSLPSRSDDGRFACVLCRGFSDSDNRTCGREKLGPALRKYIIGDRSLLIDRSEELAVLSLQGPKATELLASLLSILYPLELPYDHLNASLSGVKPASAVFIGPAQEDMILLCSGKACLLSGI